jgi:hypothetical protein
MCKKTPGSEGTLKLDAVNDRGEFNAYIRWLGDAETMFKRALRSKEEFLGPEDTSTLDTANNLADVYLAQGEAMYERILRSREKTLGPNHISTRITANRLRSIQAARGKGCRRNV